MLRSAVPIAKKLQRLDSARSLTYLYIYKYIHTHRATENHPTGALREMSCKKTLKGKRAEEKRKDRGRKRQIQLMQTHGPTWATYAARTIHTARICKIQRLLKNDVGIDAVHTSIQTQIIPCEIWSNSGAAGTSGNQTIGAQRTRAAPKRGAT